MSENYYNIKNNKPKIKNWFKIKRRMIDFSVSQILYIYRNLRNKK